jgi:hypothetical protein
MKYRPEFPERFGCIADARAFGQVFFGWYNHEHRHSGIGLHTPADVHYGRAAGIRAARADTLTAAYAAHLERFVRKHPEPPALPGPAWINNLTRPTQRIPEDPVPGRLTGSEGLVRGSFSTQCRRSTAAGPPSRTHPRPTSSRPTSPSAPRPPPA